ALPPGFEALVAGNGHLHLKGAKLLLQGRVSARSQRSRARASSPPAAHQQHRQAASLPPGCSPSPSSWLATSAATASPCAYASPLYLDGAPPPLPSVK